MKMQAMITRNLKVFFRDRLSVFFSLLSIFIIIGLYVLFLGDVMMQGMKEYGPHVRYMMDSWIMAGMLAVTSVTTTLGAFGIMVEDKAKKLDRDFTAAPISRQSLVGGYVFAAMIIGVIISLLALVLTQGYIFAYGGELFAWDVLLKLLGLILLSVLSSSAMMFFLISFIKSSNAFGTASTLIGTTIGFLTGVYIPVGNLPDAVQVVVKIFPVSHAAALFRQVMMERPMELVFTGQAAAGKTAFEQELGVQLFAGGQPISPWVSLGLLVACAVVFYALGVWRVSRSNRQRT